MSQIARVFVVLNLLLAAGFLFTAATFLGLNNDWKGKHETVAKKAKEEAARHEAALSEKDKALAEKESLLNAARDAESKATAANQQLKTQVEAAEADKKAKDTQLDQAQKNVASVTENLKRTQDALQAKIDENTKLRAETAEAQQKEREANGKYEKEHADVVARDNKIADMEKSAKSADDKIHQLGLLIEIAQKQGFDMKGGILMEPVNASVLNVDMGMKLVQVNAGKNAKVARGYVLDIVRGNTYIGRIKVDQVFDASCAGTLTVVAPGQTVMVGDKATNTLN